VEAEHGLPRLHHASQQRQPGQQQQWNEPGLDGEQGDDDAPMEAMAPTVPISPSTIWIGRATDAARTRRSWKEGVS
jgi:hypothetical protein